MKTLLKELLKLLWKYKLILFTFAMFLYAEDSTDRIIWAIWGASLGVEIKIRNLFEKHFGKK